jgi:hypothetical protein
VALVEHRIFQFRAPPRVGQRLHVQPPLLHDRPAYHRVADLPHAGERLLLLALLYFFGVLWVAFGRGGEVARHGHRRAHACRQRCADGLLSGGIFHSSRGHSLRQRGVHFPTPS